MVPAGKTAQFSDQDTLTDPSPKSIFFVGAFLANLKFWIFAQIWKKFEFSVSLIALQTLEQIENRVQIVNQDID